MRFPFSGAQYDIQSHMVRKVHTNKNKVHFMSKRTEQKATIFKETLNAMKKGKVTCHMWNTVL